MLALWPMQNNICAIILAAGKGTRMKSLKPKVLHEILGLPLIWYPYHLARHLSEEIIAVIGHGREQVGAYLDRFKVTKVVQDPPLGTGHAILQARNALLTTTAEHILIIPGDMPLIGKASLGGLIEAYMSSDATMGVLTARLDNPFGYGRIIRSKRGRMVSIVEEPEANPQQKKIHEVNTGVYIIKKKFLLEAVEKLSPDNAKGEFYLTDIVRLSGNAVSFEALDPNEANGINSQEQLALAASSIQERINRVHMVAGVSLIDPKTIWIGPMVTIAKDVEIWPNVHILGKSEIKDMVRIMPNTWISDTTIDHKSAIGHNCILEGAVIAPDTFVPPYSHIMEA